MAAYRRLRAELGHTAWYHSPGSFAWYGDRRPGERLVARVAELRDVGYPAALLPPSRARELEPDLRLAPSVKQVAFFPDEGYASPRAMIAELIGLARDRGVRTRWNAPVVALEDGPAAMLASGERIEADAVVLCCGRWSGEVAGLAGLDIPMIAGEAGSTRPRLDRAHGAGRLAAQAPAAGRRPDDPAGRCGTPAAAQRRPRPQGRPERLRASTSTGSPRR